MRTQKIKIFIILACTLTMSINCNASNPYIGQWITIDDNSGKIKSIIEIFEKNNKIFGKIKQVELKQNNSLCKKCKGKKNNKHIKGMTILSNLTKDNKKYSDGEILDPENGKKYDCNIWIEDNLLKVRGYIGIFYRTQIWIKRNYSA